METYSVESNNFYGDSTVIQVWGLFRVFMEKLWQIK